MPLKDQLRHIHDEYVEGGLPDKFKGMVPMIKENLAFFEGALDMSDLEEDGIVLSWAEVTRILYQRMHDANDKVKEAKLPYVKKIVRNTGTAINAVASFVDLVPRVVFRGMGEESEDRARELVSGQGFLDIFPQIARLNNNAGNTFLDVARVGRLRLPNRAGFVDYKRPDQTTALWTSYVEQNFYLANGELAVGHRPLSRYRKIMRSFEVKKGFCPALLLVGKESGTLVSRLTEWAVSQYLRHTKFQVYQSPWAYSSDFHPAVRKNGEYLSAEAMGLSPHLYEEYPDDLLY